MKSQEEKRLQELRAKMSKQQREQMSEILQSEMKRRGMEQKETKNEQELPTGRQGVAEGRVGAKSVLKFALLVAIAGLGGAKIYLNSVGAPANEARALLERELPVSGERGSRGEEQVPLAVVKSERVQNEGIREREIVADLDARRVELERRKEGLDRREEELKAQADALTERLAELRGLTARLGEVRKTEDTRRQSKFDQLANVYSAMAPNEAATLLSRLEPSITIDLLERMPEKRIGQILGLMDRDRAVELTRLLTERKITP